MSQEGQQAHAADGEDAAADAHVEEKGERHE